jgi:hypothetical protein
MAGFVVTGEKDLLDSLKKMVPERQVEAAELMAAMNTSTISYAKTLLAGTPETQLIRGRRRTRLRGITEE